MTDGELVRALAEILPQYRPFQEHATLEGDVLLSRFDSLVARQYCLFSMEDTLDFDRLEANLRRIAHAMPSLMRIFEHPLIHLCDTEETVPVEAARKISSETLRHAAVHTELWDGDNRENLRPKKLMTSKTEDDYRIYENRVFAYVIDRILDYCVQSRRQLSGRIFNTMTLNINLLDHANHKNYFLALATLHSGYERGTDVSFERAEADYRKIRKLEQTLRSRLHYRAYRLNRGLFSGGEIRSTNILTMHRDYRALGYIARHFRETERNLPLPTEAEQREFFGLYRRYCSVLLLFSLLNYGFSGEENGTVSLYEPAASLELGDCRLRLSPLENPGCRGFLLEFRNRNTYRVALLPYGSFMQSGLAGLPIHDELLVLTPFYRPEDGELPIAIDDVNSFRRLQQVLLRGMIYADGVFTVCPFCGSNMKPAPPEATDWDCPACHSRVRREYCPDTGKEYFATAIPEFRFSGKDREYAHDSSALLRYRNITEITPEGTILCPHCGKPHGSSVLRV